MKRAALSFAILVGAVLAIGVSIPFVARRAVGELPAAASSAGGTASVAALGEGEEMVMPPAAPQENAPVALVPPSFEKTGGDVAPALHAEKVLLADMQSGDIFFAVREQERWPTASLAKLMTAFIVLRRMDLASPITLTAEDFAGEEDSSRNLKIGGVYRTEDLLRAMLLESANEAAEGLARSYGRSRFIADMNAVAREWGLLETNFDDPSGMSAASQTTAADLLKLATLTYYNHRNIFDMTRSSPRVITELVSKKRIVVTSVNKFVGQRNFLGGKTGYTDEASGNLVTVFSYARRPIVIAVLGTDDRFGDTERLLAWFTANFKARL